MFLFLFWRKSHETKTKPNCGTIQYVCCRARLKKGWVVWDPSCFFRRDLPTLKTLFSPSLFLFLKQRIPLVRVVSPFTTGRFARVVFFCLTLPLFKTGSSYIPRFAVEKKMWKSRADFHLRFFQSQLSFPFFARFRQDEFFRLCKVFFEKFSARRMDVKYVYICLYIYTYSYVDTWFACMRVSWCLCFSRFLKVQIKRFGFTTKISTPWDSDWMASRESGTGKVENPLWENPADALTKCLGSSIFGIHRAAMGFRGFGRSSGSHHGHFEWFCVHWGVLQTGLQHFQGS